MSKIDAPHRATINESFELIACATKIETDAKATVLNLASCTRFGPIGTTMLALALARRRQAGLPELRIEYPERGASREFLDEINFERFSSGHAERLGSDETHGSLEIRQLQTLEPKYTEDIARLLASRVPGTSEDVSHFIQLCLNELLQNVFEHAESKQGAFAHSRWFAEKKNVRLAVVDGGIGIPGALRRAKKPEFVKLYDDQIIVEAVTTKGVTSREGTRMGGLGLKHIHDVVTSRNGSLCVISLTAKVTFKGKSVQSSKCPRFKGTAIEIDFRPQDPPDEPTTEVFG